jgi:branched-chain amino acid transport system substrate-binding protein
LSRSHWCRLAIALALASTGCGSSGGGDGEIVIGAAGPFTDSYGALTRDGAQLAIDELNARGGVRGRKLRLKPVDDSASGSRAIGVAEEFVADPAVVAVVGHVNSGAMLTAAKVYDGNLAAIATAASSPLLTGISEWTFRVISNDSANALEMARYASRRGYKRAAILYENDGYGRALASLFRKHFTGEIISSDPIASTDKDLEPFVSYYRERKPDLVFVAGTENTGLVVLREALRQRLAADFMGGDGWVGVTLDTAASEGAIVGTPFTTTDPRPQARQFVEAFRRKFNREPDANAALAYDAAMTIGSAIEAVGTDRAAIREWIAGIGARKPLEGVTGSIAFQKTGDRVGRGMVMTRARRGSLTVEGGE